jgi:hypothetical protein
MKNINRHKPDRMRKIKLQQGTTLCDTLFALNVAMPSLLLPTPGSIKAQQEKDRASSSPTLLKPHP